MFTSDSQYGERAKSASVRFFRVEGSLHSLELMRGCDSATQECSGIPRVRLASLRRVYKRMVYINPGRRSAPAVELSGETLCVGELLGVEIHDCRFVVAGRVSGLVRHDLSVSKHVNRSSVHPPSGKLIKAPL